MKEAISCLKDDHENLCIVYDNFDYQERVHHQVIGENSTLRHFTTGKVFLGREITCGGLRQDMLHNHIQIDIDDIVSADGHQHDHIQDQISKYLILDAIRTAYPDEIHSLLHSSKEPITMEMPRLDILPPERTSTTTLGPIPAEEGTIAGNYDILHDIFIHQLGFNPDVDFSTALFLAFGDRLTVARIRSIQFERREAIPAYDRFNWVLPVSAFFHLRMNFLYMINKSHYGDENGAPNQYSTLLSHINALHRKNIPPGSAPFHHLEELTIHSFKARIVALFLLYIKEQTKGRCNVTDADQVSAYLASISPVDFQCIIDNIHQTAFAEDIRDKVNAVDSAHCVRGKKKKGKVQTDPTPATDDEEFTNHIRYLQEMETYCTLKHAIKHADVGLLKRVIARCCFYFHGSGATNYASEMLHIWRLLSTEACDPPLKRAILVNGLINLRGQEDSWLEIDRHNEHLNLELKTLLNARRNGTFDVDSLFDYGGLCCEYSTATMKFLESSFGERTVGSHTTKSAASDIRFLADILKDSSIVNKKGRSCQHKSINTVYAGLDQLLSGALDNFNKQFVRANKRRCLAGPFLIDDSGNEDVGVDGDMPSNIQMLSLEVRCHNCLHFLSL